MLLIIVSLPDADGDPARDVDSFKQLF